MSLKVGLIGAGGLIGSALYQSLYSVFEVKVIKSSALYLPATELSLQLNDLDIIINLAGHPVAGRWTSAKKQKIYNSRINTTRNLVDAILLLDKKPTHIINASAIGLYPDGVKSDESSTIFSDNYLSFVVRMWEAEVSKLAEENINFTVIRIGVVLSNKGGFFPKIKPLFKLGLGGKMGSGNQGFSFIWINDLVRAVNFVIEKKLFGIVNLVSPEPLSNAEFTVFLAKFFNRPAFIAVPEFALKAILRDGASIILEGQYVSPKRLIDEGFDFEAKNLLDCLRFLEK